MRQNESADKREKKYLMGQIDKYEDFDNFIAEFNDV